MYASGVKDLPTAKSYSTAVPLGNDGIYFRAVLELRVTSDKYLKSNAQTKGHFVFQPDFCRIMAIRFYARHLTYGCASRGTLFWSFEASRNMQQIR